MSVLSEKVDGLGGEVRMLSSRVDSLEVKVDNLDIRVCRVEEKLDEHWVENRHEFSRVWSRFDDLEKQGSETKAVVDSIFNMLDKESVTTEVHDAEIGAIKSQVNRHDNWINRVGEKLSIAQEYA